MSETKAAHISGIYGLLAVVLGAILLFFKGCSCTPEPEMTLRFVGVPVVIPQTVNQKGIDGPDGYQNVGTDKESAAFRFEIENLGKEEINLKQGDLIVDSVEFLEAGMSTAALHVQIDHQGHIKIALDDLKKGGRYTFRLDMVMPPESRSEFVVWFTSDAKAAVVRVKGRLKLEATDEQGRIITITSEPITIEMHPNEPYTE